MCKCKQQKNKEKKKYAKNSMKLKSNATVHILSITIIIIITTQLNQTLQGKHLWPDHFIHIDISQLIYHFARKKNQIRFRFRSSSIYLFQWQTNKMKKKKKKGKSFKNDCNESFSPHSTHLKKKKHKHTFSIDFTIVISHMSLMHWVSNYHSFQSIYIE